MESGSPSPGSYGGVEYFSHSGRRWPQLVLMCAMHHDTWIFDEANLADIRPVIEHMAKARNPTREVAECQFTAFIAWTFQPDKRYMWEYEGDPDAQNDDVSKLEHERLAQIGANWRVREVISGLVEAKSDEDLDLINDLANAVLYTDDRDTVIPLLKATLAGIDSSASKKSIAEDRAAGR